MGIWRFAGAFTVAQRQSECGSKNLRNARQPPMDIGVCYSQFFVCRFIFKTYGNFMLPCSFTNFHSPLFILVVSTGVGKIQYFRTGLISTILRPPYPNAPIS